MNSKLRIPLCWKEFQLTARLWPALIRANGARVINVSSQGHHFASFNFADPNFLHREYDTLKGYGQSKTAVNLFSMELDNRAHGKNVRVYSVHPGSIGGTELGREAPLALFQKMGFVDENGKIRPEVAASLKTVPQGAATTVWCASSPLLDNIGGVYCEDADIAPLCADISHQNGVKPYSLDENSAQKLWALTEDMIGLQFCV